MTIVTINKASKFTSNKQERNFLVQSKNLLEDKTLDSINRELWEAKIWGYSNDGFYNYWLPQRI